MNNWQNTVFIRQLSGQIPKLPGVYAVLRVVRSLDLPSKLEVIYVGKSKNLRRRFGEHLDPWNMGSKGFAVLGRDSTWEFWYLELLETELDFYERKLIRETNPKVNNIKFKNG